MKHKKLYSLRSDGKIQSWELETVNDSYRVTSGIEDGKKVTSEWTVCTTKNEGRSNATTAKEQAMIESLALWKKKHDSGYRESVKDLKNVDIFEPMLAKDYNDYKDTLEYPVYCQPKLDGIRIIARKEGLFTRTGKRHMCLRHIEKALQPYFDEFPDLVIDGEGYADKFSNDFNRICSIIRKVKPTEEDLLESETHVRFHVYDCKTSDSDDNFIDRYNNIKALLSEEKYVKMVETYEAHSEKELDEYYESFVSAGYEGQIVRKNKPYENKRSRNLLKRKEFIDSEYTILNVGEGIGNRSGTAGYLVFKNKEGKEFHSNIKGNHAYVEGMWKRRKELIGKEATVKYFQLTEDNVPRFPYVIAIRDYE